MISFKSFHYAYEGLRHVLSFERNARLHAIIALCAVIVGLILRINLSEWLFVIISIVLVFFAEITNTAIERTLDLLSPHNNHNVKIIKDMTAAGVLVCSCGALIVACVVFGPKIYQLIEQLIV